MLVLVSPTITSFVSWSLPTMYGIMFQLLLHIVFFACSIAACHASHASCTLEIRFASGWLFLFFTHSAFSFSDDTIHTVHAIRLPRIADAPQTHSSRQTISVVRTARYDQPRHASARTTARNARIDIPTSAACSGSGFSASLAQQPAGQEEAIASTVHAIQSEQIPRTQPLSTHRQLVSEELDLFLVFASSCHRPRQQSKERHQTSRQQPRHDRRAVVLVFADLASATADLTAMA